MRASDSKGFGEFYAAQWSDVFGYVYSLCSDAAVAEEIAQEALSRVFSRWPVREPRPYCFRVATNLVRDHVKAERRTSPERDVAPVARSVGVDPELLDAVRRLSPAQGEVVLLHYYADMPLAEVATTLRRPLGTVKRQAHQARAALAAMWKDSHA